ncbi:MAG TPA: trypsin-like peptidase domain-containing protein [Gemmatimonadaceae bacterium]|jgi:serine protease Do|nr:trypsin-like peptidase domain-containing protein [Gemmatimonadaceae bacterium]
MTSLNETIGTELDAIAGALRGVTVSVQSARSRRSAPSGRSGSGAGQGAGIVWSPDGTIVTNAHVAAADSATITLSDGRVALARMVSRDARRDLAVLRIDAGSLGGPAMRAAVMGQPSALRTGEMVLALGHPLGVEHALTMGVVHAAPQPGRSPYVVADIRLAPGNSGGPLADASGRVVGVNSMIVGGLGVAISIDVVREMLAGSAPRPTLGVQLRPVRVRIPSGAKESSVGLLVLALDPHGAAARAGIIQGDVLLGHAGRPFANGSELGTLLRDASPGTMLRFDVGRGGHRFTCEVVPGSAFSSGRRAA